MSKFISESEEYIVRCLKEILDIDKIVSEDFAIELNLYLNLLFELLLEISRILVHDLLEYIEFLQDIFIT